MRFAISNNIARGYEVNFSIKGTYLQTVRWNGPHADYTQLNNDGTQNFPFSPTNGMPVRAQIVGNTISIWCAGVLAYTITDNVWSNGCPGMGFYIDQGSAGNSTNFGWSNYWATVDWTNNVFSNGSDTNTQTKINASTNGQSIILPAGTFAWTNGITNPNGRNLIGMGGTNDTTVIVDNIASGSAVLDITANTNSVFRMTGIAVQSGTGATKDNGTVKINGPGMIHLDRLHLNMTSSANYKALMLGSGVFGVLDHSILDLSELNAIYLYNGRCGAGENQGDLEWSLPTDFGGTNYFFVEDNVINGSTAGTVYPTRVFDGFTASKVVVRFNTLVAACLSETHDTGHSGDDRGMRSQEIYGNVVTSPLAKDPNYAAVTMGNGCALAWGNSWDQVYKNIYSIKVVRKDNSVYPQTAFPAGWGYAGTAFNGAGSMWDGGTALGTDTVLGYPCLDQPGRGQGDLLVGTFPTKTNSVTGSMYWPHNALEPIYLWNNTGAIVAGWGGTTYSDISSGRVVSDRDYYKPASGIQTSPTSPFNGTSGTGWGTLANRPTTCTAGVAYFATDQGAWNKSASNPYGVQQSGANGVLYKATAANTWSVYYVPYTYPHPLNSGANPDPNITVQPASQAVTAPATATFSVTASGLTALSYQWNRAGTNVTGATQSSYTTPATATGDNGQAVYVTVTDTAGGVQSATATLFVNGAGGGNSVASSLRGGSGVMGGNGRF